MNAEVKWPFDFDKELERRDQVHMIISSSPEPRITADSFYGKSCVAFIRDCCITYDPRNPSKGLPAKMPFIPFMKQVELVGFVLGLLDDQNNGLTEKSRDMGATWICVCISVWLWIYRPGSAIGWGSRKEALVDRIGDPDSIFEKIRMVIRSLPHYCIPVGFVEKEHLNYMKCINPENSATITGESGDNIGRGGRSSIYFKDESAHYERAELIEASLGDNTNVQVDISSVCGEGTVFHRKRNSGVVKVFIMDWRDHPAKDQAWYDKRKSDAEAQGLSHIFAQEVDRDYSAAVEGIFIPSEYVKAAIDAHKVLNFEATGAKRAGQDVADEGGDKNVLIAMHGQIITHIDQWALGDASFSATKAWNYCIEHGINTLVYDSIGVGSGVKAKTNELLKLDQFKDVDIDVWGFAARGRGGVVNPKKEYVKGRKNEDMFSSNKAQAWWIMRDRFHDTYRAVVLGEDIPVERLISIPSEHLLTNELVSELSRPKREDDEAGRIGVESKKKLKARGIPSHNLVDALVMCFAPKKKPREVRVMVI